jgi:hypothetical protein
MALSKFYFKFSQEPSHGHPEIISYHDDALHLAPIALPQGLHQISVLIFLPGVQPLLELVEDDQNFPADRDETLTEDSNCANGLPSIY